MPFAIRPLTMDDAAAVHALLLRSPGCTGEVRQREVAEDDAREILTTRPPRATLGSSFVLGLLDVEGTLHGLCEVITHWPEPGTARIGRLLVNATMQRRGLGRLLHDSLLAQLRAEGDIHRLRAELATTDADRARRFWESLGYRPTDGSAPCSAAAVDSAATVLTRELVIEASEPSPAPDVAVAAPVPIAGVHHAGVHHLELWTADLAAAEPAWHWLLTALGWHAEQITGWETGRVWRHLDGSYIVLEQSPDVVGGRSERRAPGMNHIALAVRTRTELEAIRNTAAQHGWNELFSTSFPHAGGPDHVAWYAEDPEGIEVELVAPPSSTDTSDTSGSPSSGYSAYPA